MGYLESLLKKTISNQKIMLLIVGVILFIFFAIIKPAYASYENIMNIILSACTNGCLAIAVTFVIISGGIDLSIGPLMTFTAIMSGIALTRWGWPLWICIIFGIIVGVICGIINGFMIAKMKLPPFIATLAMMMVLKGLNLVISEVKPIYFTSDERYQKIALGSVLEIIGIKGFYNAILIFIIVVLVAHLILSKTLLGRYTYAIGSNMEAVRLSGIRVDRWLIAIYATCGFFTGIAGLIMSSRLNSAQPQLGPGYEMEAIAATVIGGASLSGGEGSALGTLLGAIIMSELQNGLRAMAVTPELQFVIIGVVVVLAVYVDQLRNKRK